MSIISSNCVLFHKVSLKNLFPKLLPSNLALLGESYHLIMNWFLRCDKIVTDYGYLQYWLTDKEEKGSFTKLMTFKSCLKMQRLYYIAINTLPPFFYLSPFPSQKWGSKLTYRVYFCTHQHYLKISFVWRGVLYKCLHKRILSYLLETKSRQHWVANFLVDDGNSKSR